MLTSKEKHKAKKSDDYHSKVGKTIFQNTNISDLLYRRLIKISMISFYNLPTNPQL